MLWPVVILEVAGVYIGKTKKAGPHIKTLQKEFLTSCAFHPSIAMCSS